jgi:hypothetical protein
MIPILQLRDTDWCTGLKKNEPFGAFTGKDKHRLRKKIL